MNRIPLAVSGPMVNRWLRRARERPGFIRGELTVKLVGLIGGGHIVRRLLEYLGPLKVRVLVHDPYLPLEMADALGFDLTLLDNVLSLADVVVCLAPAPR